MGPGSETLSRHHPPVASPRGFLVAQLRLRALGLLCIAGGIAWLACGPTSGDEHRDAATAAISPTGEDQTSGFFVEGLEGRPAEGRASAQGD